MFDHGQNIAECLRRMISLTARIDDRDLILIRRKLHVRRFQSAKHKHGPKSHNGFNFIFEIGKRELRGFHIQKNGMPPKLGHSRLERETRPCRTFLKKHNESFVRQKVGQLPRLPFFLDGGRYRKNIGDIFF
jgi:hypothetical protein